MIISFSGSSGAGKSTIIAELIKNDSFKGKKVIVREEDSFATIKLANRLLGDGIFSRYKEGWYFKKKYNDFPYKLFTSLSYVMYPLVVYFEFLVVYIWYELIFRNSILIIDKFIYDHEVNFKTLLKTSNKFLEWLYGRFPKPYLSFLIDINLSNAAIVRNKHNVTGMITATKLFHDSVLKSFLQVAKKRNIVIIDNNGNLSDTIKSVERHIANKKKLTTVKRVAICGLDGAGKTTIVNRLARYADSLNIKCKTAHFIYNNVVYKLLVSIGYYRFDTPKKYVWKKKREQSARERFIKPSLIMILLRYLDSYVQYLFYKIVYRNQLIIFDRFFYDYLVSFKYYNIQPHQFFRPLLPKIKNGFLLNTPPLVSYRRKPERVKAFFTECHEIYLKVAQEQNMKIISTKNKNPDAILNEMLEQIN